jgi:tetratricopeptide (TPR) repeat protein
MKSLFLLLFFCELSMAQTSDKVSTAFSESYAAESSQKYSDAIAKLEALKNDGYEVNLRLGWLQYLNKNYTKSLQHYKKASELMPESVEPLLGQAYPLSALTHWDELIPIYNKILTIDPKNSIVNYRMGLIYYYKKEYAKAEKYFAITSKLYPFDYDCSLMTGWNKLFLGKFDEAKILFKRVLLIYPGDASAIEGLGYMK